MLSDKEHDESEQKRLTDVLREATDTVPSSVGLWHARINRMLQSGQEKEVDTIFPKVIYIANDYIILPAYRDVFIAC